MKAERHGKYQLTMNQLVREVRKTDKLVEDVEKALTKLYDHCDKSNSAKRDRLLEDNREFFEELVQSREMPY